MRREKILFIADVIGIILGKATRFVVIVAIICYMVKWILLRDKKQWQRFLIP